MLLSFLSFVGLAAACADHELHPHHSRAHTHIHERREYPPTVLTPPYRPLTWGDFNVIHTTDTHGWLLGHQKSGWAEPYYSGDLGDFASFVAHMQQIAIEKDVDLLLVDSGDLHDGTGLSDGYPPGGVDAHESNKFIMRLPYDLMTIGNHELYIYANTYDMYTNFVPHVHGSYLSSNVNITVFDSDGEAMSVPVGKRYVTFKTRKGRKVTSLGVLFDFTLNDVNTTVQPVAEMVQENWFKEAIADEPDVFLLIGHMPVSKSDSNNKWSYVFDAIRAIHRLTPILIFGGHSHIRDCSQYDGRSMALESGYYMETIGWMSAELDASKGNSNDIAFSRRYLDQNRVTYEYHTKRSNLTFDTVYGRSITEGLEQLAVDFNLSYLYGEAPRDYTLNQDPYGSSGSLWSLFIENVVPETLKINNTRAQIPNIIIINNGPLRYDVFQGPFTKNDQLTASPYTDDFSYIANVTFSVANQMIHVLNNPSASAKHKRDEFEQEPLDHGRVQAHPWQGEQDGHATTPSENIPYGYNTTDSCPGLGDDTLHVNLPHYKPPLFMGSSPPNVTDGTPIDLVFLTFIVKDVLSALNQLQSKTYTKDDVSSYSDILTRDMLSLYAQAHWN